MIAAVIDCRGTVSFTWSSARKKEAGMCQPAQTSRSLRTRSFHREEGGIHADHALVR